MDVSIEPYLEIRVALPTSFSPDGSKVLAASNLTGTMQLYRVPTAGGPPETVTAEDEPVSGVYLPTADRVLVAVDSGGNERHQLYLCDDTGGPLTAVVVEPEWIHAPGGISRDGNLLSYRCNRRNGVDFDVYVRRLDDGQEDCVFAPGGWAQPTAFSPDGRWLGVVRMTERNMDNDLYLVETGGPEVIYVSPHDDDAEFSGPAWLADSSGFYFATNQGRDTTAVARYDLTARSWEYVLDTEWDAACTIDRSGTRLLVTTNEDGYTRGQLYHPTTLAPLGSLPLPGTGVAANFTFSPDGRWLAYHFTSATEPGDIWVVDTEDLSPARRLTSSPNAVPASLMVEPRLERFASFDGESVPVFLYLPPAPRRSPPPVVVVIHGGPEGQSLPAFNPVVQYLAARGYGVAVPNVRGSVGYGKRYHHLDDVRNRLDSVRDLASLHEWLADRGDVDAARAALYGGSYGGYMVLAGLVFQPDRWAAGVDIVGISSLVTFLENTSPWRRKFREREYGSLERDRDFLQEASPINHLHQLRAPLLIIHGANDPRVPLSEAEQLHRSLQDKGVRCDLLVYHDEGHGLQKLVNRLDAYPRVASFLDEVLV